MKILLVGEYSRLHNTLKEGLIQLGHQVTLIATGDYFKNYPVDIKLYRKYNVGLFKKVKVGLFILFKIDITSLSLKKQFFSHQEKLNGYDIVQLINECSIGATPKVEKQIVSFLKQYNKKLFLLSCGTDHISVKFAMEKKFRYSILTPLHQDSALKSNYQFILKYLTKPYIKLHEFLYKNSDGVIASDLDYHIPLKNHPKYSGLIPNPINLDILKYKPLIITGKINIFHGINKTKNIKKGNVFFEDALIIIKQKYAEKINIVSVENIPYNQYIKLYDDAHILLDQVYAYDQGYNALEAMAKGKVVFTGAEQEWLEHYNLKEDTVAINAVPDVEKIASKLEWLILNPDKICAISKNARAFIEKEHNYIKIAEKYCNTWFKKN